MICSNWRTDNDENVTQVTGPWKLGQGQATPVRLTFIPYNVCRLNIVELSVIVIENHTSWKCDASHWTMKMRSSDTCAVLFWQKNWLEVFWNLHHSRTNPKSPILDPGSTEKGSCDHNAIALTSLQDIKLECEGCRVGFITLDEFLTFMTCHQVCSMKYHDGCHMRSWNYIPFRFLVGFVLLDLCFCRSLFICFFPIDHCIVCFRIAPSGIFNLFLTHLFVAASIIFCQILIQA